MGKKRKRPIKNGGAREHRAQKRLADGPNHVRSHHAADFQNKREEHSHPVISLYYRRVVTLRQYLLQQIPVTSKSRRRRITSVRADSFTAKQRERDAREARADVRGLADILDTTLVGVLKESSPTVSQERRREFASYSQSQSQERSELPSTDSGSSCAQAEIVDFVISALFNRHAFSYQKPQHLLTHGFQRAGGPHSKLTSSIPGLSIRFPNKNAQSLKQAPWINVLGLLGGSGEEIMLRLLFDCGIFMAIDHRKGVYYQLSGIPLSSLETIKKELPLGDVAINIKPSLAMGGDGTTADRSSDQRIVHKPNSVVFFRRRMLYARPILDWRGKPRFGLTNLHVLNRYPQSDSLAQTVHILKYIFPRQFGLHNVFTSVTNSRETVLPFKDYFSREAEISEIEEKRHKQRRRIGPEFTNHYKEQKEFIEIPKRLRGKACELVQQLQNRNRGCPYTELLNYYCPPEDLGPWRLDPTDSQISHQSSEPLVTQSRNPKNSSAHPSTASHRQGNPSVAASKAEATASKISKPKLGLMDYATPGSSVSAFCRAALRKLVPPQFYGTGCHQKSNRDIIFKHIDRFVRMRRFESLSLHEVCKGIKITCIPWLECPATRQGQSSSQPKISLSDLRKRTELLHEFIYYLFDSILVPLIRSNFYVTESQSHRNRLFYFRHEVWQQLTQRPLADFKSSLFEKMKRGVAERRLSSRSLGYSSLRLLPKPTGVRPILNLRRRMLKPGWAGKTPFLGPSINSTVTPVFNVLNYEKRRNPDSLGASLSSVGEIHTRLKHFKERLVQQHADQSRPPLYFVKVDIQGCFDTIPQENLISLVERLISEEGYHVAKHVEVRPPDEFSSMWPPHESQQSKALRRYVGRAAPVTNPQHLTQVVAEGGISHRRNTVFVDTPAHTEYSGDYLLDLLDEHVRYNLVRVGNKYFRQRNGIPQGSILSSMLCNLFYARMERESLGFLQPDEAVLLRLIDDFLLVTTDPRQARRFLQVMLQGHPAYGMTVNPAKSLVNFAAVVDGVSIPRLEGSALFPYCGNLIHTMTLELYRDQERVLEGSDSAAATLASTLTVESARTPGRALHRKLLSAFKLQMHPMYLDTQHNSVSTVLANLHATFVTAAMKMYQYMKALPRRTHPTPEVVVRIIRDLIQLGCRMVRAPAGCLVLGAQVQYLAAAAFRFVLGRKQTKYAVVLRWLEQMWKVTRPASDSKAMQLAQVVRQGNASFASWRF